MKLSDITKELSKLFNSMGDAGGIVVWHDPDTEFTEVAAELELPGVEIMREEENDSTRTSRAVASCCIARARAASRATGSRMSRCARSSSRQTT